MSDGYKIRSQSLPHFVTATVVEWIDVFTRKVHRDAVIECLDFCIKNKGMVLYGYVIMSNHVHLVIQSKHGKLSDLIRDFKKFTAKRIIEQIQNGPESRREWMLERFGMSSDSHSRNKTYQFWKYGNHPEEIFSNSFMWSKLHYLHLNPVRTGLVEKASHYIYSSASNYINDRGILNITKADNPIVDTLKVNNVMLFEDY